MHTFQVVSIQEQLSTRADPSQVHMMAWPVAEMDARGFEGLSHQDNSRFIQYLEALNERKLWRDMGRAFSQPG